MPWSSDRVISSDLPTVQIQEPQFLECLKAKGGTCGHTGEGTPPPVLPTTTDAEVIHAYLDASGALGRTKVSDREAAPDPDEGNLLETQKKLAYDVLTNPELDRIERLMRHLGGQPVTVGGGAAEAAQPFGGGSASFSFNTAGLRSYLELVEKTAKLDAWTPALKCVNSKGKKPSDCPRDLESAPLPREEKGRLLLGKQKTSRVLSFLKAYYDAYFRSGMFVTVSLDASKLKTKLNEKLKNEFPGIDEGSQAVDLGKLVDDLVREITGKEAKEGRYTLLGKISDRALVTRDGRKLQFQEIPIALAPVAEKQLVLPKLDLVEAGSEIVRVFFEAVGDAVLDTPGDPSSTGCTIKGDYQLTTFRALDSTDDTEKKKQNVTSEEFGLVATWANRTEALTGAVTGRLIRGISIFSLNNEGLATLIETAIASAARKGAEKFAWCAYACRIRPKGEAAPPPDDAELHGLPLPASAAVFDTKIELR